MTRNNFIDLPGEGGEGTSLFREVSLEPEGFSTVAADGCASGFLAGFAAGLLAVFRTVFFFSSVFITPVPVTVFN